MKYKRSLTWKHEPDRNDSWFATIPGMANIEIFYINRDGLVQIIINDQDSTIEGTTEEAIIWAEGYVAGRFQEIKIEIKK